MLCFFDGLRADEDRLRWDRLVAHHLLVSGFLNLAGYDMQHSDDEYLAKVVGQFRQPRIAANLVEAIDKLGLGGEANATRIQRALRARPEVGALLAASEPASVGERAESAQMSEAAEHFPFIARALVRGRVTPFLGAGANRCGRPEGEAFRKGGQFLPDGRELAASIAREFGVTETDYSLLQISQYVSLMSPDDTDLERYLHDVFDFVYPPTHVHTFLAGFPARLREAGLPPNDQLIVTANYDDTLERAFDEAGEPYDLVSFYQGKFVHWAPGADRTTDEPVLIDDPQSYHRIDEDEGVVILKVHGLVHSKWETFVITEDDYIDYLTRTDINRLLPVNIVNRLKRSSFLFLGYSLRDWNIRAILHTLSRDQLEKQHWAVLLNPDRVERKLWDKRKVRIVEIPLDEFLDGVEQHLASRFELEREELQAEQAP